MKRWILGLALLAACGDSTTPETDAGEGVDGGTPVDAGVDSGTDGGTSPDVGPPDAGPERCPEEGAMRSASCGNCGMGQEICTDGAWVASGPCLGEGECAPGALEEEDLPMCAAQTRICMETCEWSEFEETTAPGDCDPGETRPSMHCDPGLGGEDTCSEECGWEPGTCESPCTDLRTEPMFEREVCVPAGPFIRGDESDPWARPVAEIHLSTFAIDRHPVTNARFRECVMAGVCREHHLYPTSRGDGLAARAAFGDALAFCRWDGGRRLPTDAEWQKAQRGPAPRNHPYIMGDEWDCDVLPFECPGFTCEVEPSVGEYPGATSYYGMEDGQSVPQWLNDWFDTDYYQRPESRLDDPQGPAEVDGRHAAAGGVCSRRSIGRRRSAGEFGGVPFRCARSIGEE